MSTLNRLDGAVEDQGFTCSYNGYTFGPSADTTNFSVRPVLDPAGRTVTHAIYSITVQETVAYFSVSETTDAAIEDAISRLSRNGGQLVYTGRGFGNLAINIGGLRDVKWGPVTKNISCTPTGAGLAVLLSWTVEFCIPNCDDAQYKGILYFNFKYGFAIDKHGYTTRTYSSELAIAATKKNVRDRTLPDNADLYREKTVPRLLNGFRRESQSFDLSYDKQKLNTTVVDVQMPFEPPPQGCVEASFEQTFQTQQSFAKWGVTFTGTYDIARDGGKASDAVAAFVRTVKQRSKIITDKIKQGAGLNAEAFAGAARAGSVIGGPVPMIPMSASATDVNVYGRQQVKITSTLFTCAFGLSAVLENGGLWTPVESQGKGYGNWAASLPLTMGSRGHAVLAFQSNDDTITDLCGGTKPNLITGAASSIASGLGFFDDAELRAGGGAIPAGPNWVGANLIPLAGALISGGVSGALEAELRAAFPPPSGASSWLGMRMHLLIRAATGRLLGSTLPQTSISLESQPGGSAWDAMGNIPTADPSGSPFPPLQSQLQNQGQSQSARRTGAFVQQRVKPVLYVTIMGSAVRAGHAIPMPQLIQINGKTPVLVGEPYFSQGVVYESMSCPIARAEWSLTYAFVDDGPTGFGIPDKAPIGVPPNGLYA